MVFHWSLSDNKSPQVSCTLLSILDVLNNAVVWMVFTCPPNSKSSSPFSNPLVTVQRAPITIGIIVTCMFHSFFNSLASSRYLSFFSHSFSFILWSSGTTNLTILQIFFVFVVLDYYKVSPNIGLAVIVFANGPGDLGSIQGRVIPKTQKWYLILPCLTLSIIRYGSRVKWSNPWKT